MSWLDWCQISYMSPQREVQLWISSGSHVGANKIKMVNKVVFVPG